MNSNKNITANFDPPTGIHNQKTAAIGIFPNPASDHFYVKMEDAIEANISLSDLNGKLVLKKAIFEVLNQVDISNLKLGIYALRVVSKSSNLVAKLVVLRDQENN